MLAERSDVWSLLCCRPVRGVQAPLASKGWGQSASGAAQCILHRRVALSQRPQSPVFSRRPGQGWAGQVPARPHTGVGTCSQTRPRTHTPIAWLRCDATLARYCTGSTARGSRLGGAHSMLSVLIRPRRAVVVGTCDLQTGSHSATERDFDLAHLSPTTSPPHSDRQRAFTPLGGSNAPAETRPYETGSVARPMVTERRGRTLAPVLDARGQRDEDAWLLVLAQLHFGVLDRLQLPVLSHLQVSQASQHVSATTALWKRTQTQTTGPACWSAERVPLLAPSVVAGLGSRLTASQACAALRQVMSSAVAEISRSGTQGSPSLHSAVVLFYGPLRLVLGAAQNQRELSAWSAGTGWVESDHL